MLTYVLHAHPDFQTLRRACKHLLLEIKSESETSDSYAKLVALIFLHFGD